MKPGSNGNKGQALIYCRVSTRKQEEEGASLETQALACTQLAESLGYTVGRVTREVYTGAELWDRPLLARDRADIKAGRFAAFVFHDLDRLSRDPIHRAIVLEECVRAGVEPFCVLDPLEMSDEGMLIQYIKGYAAKMERAKIRERSMRGKHYRVHSGKLLRSGTDLYGYRRTEDGDRRDIYEPEAVIVRQIFQWFVHDGVSLRQIERRLNEQGISTPAHGKRMPYKRRALSGQRWNHTQIRNILREPAYKGETILWRWKSINGRMVRRPEEEWVRLPEGTTPPIVSCELWDAAQRCLDRTARRPDETDEEYSARRDKARGEHSFAARNERLPALLRGLIFCAVCSRPMRYRRRKETGYASYICSSREHDYPCGAKPVPAGDAVRPATRPRDAEGHFLPVDADTRTRIDGRQGVESWVWDRVSAVLRDPSIVARELERHETEGPDPVLSSDLETARRAFQRIEQQQERLVQQFSLAQDEAFPWELVKQQITRLEREKAQHRSVIEELERRLADREQARARLASLTTYCERVAHNLDSFGFEEKRLALEALRVRVVANGRDWSLSGSFPTDESELLTGGDVLATSS